MNEPVGLYVHFPFCRAKCPYCHFSSRPYDESLLRAWRKGLALEAQLVKEGMTADAPEPPAAFDTLYIGGGTPSLLAPAEVADVVRLLEDSFRLDLKEFTLEAGADVADSSFVRGWRDAGVTRLSVGVQSFDDGILARLGRGCSAARAMDFCRKAGRAGFASWSLDLIIGVPGESSLTMKESLDRVLELAPDHVSLYILENVEGLPFERVLAEEPPDEDLVADLHDFCRETLEGAGLRRYEVSNFARPGAECRHNLKYWRYRPFLGLGPSASSHVGSSRWSNKQELRAWLEALEKGDDIREEVVLLTPELQAREAVIFGLRLVEGVDIEELGRRTGVDIEALFGRELEALARDGLILRENSRVRVPEEKFLVSNQVFVRLL
mgnify:CR=1 FL=1